MGSKYNNRKDVHRDVLIRDYSPFLFHAGGFQPTIQTTAGFLDSLRVSPSPPIVPATV